MSWDEQRNPMLRAQNIQNDRCNQENLIGQLKNGLNALRMPTDELVSNRAYLVMASLAWTLKAWVALVVRSSKARDEVLRKALLRNPPARCILLWAT